MRRLLFVMFFFALVFVTLFDYADAFTLNKGFGGRIITTSQPLVDCYTGIGPITIQPVGQSQSGPYLAVYGTNRTPKNQPRNGAWILGLSTATQPNCLQGVYPYKTPYSTTPITLYGVSGF